MKTKILSILLTIVMLLGVMPMAVFAEASVPSAELTFDGEFNTKTTQAEAIDLIRSGAIKPSDSANNVIKSIGTGNTSGLYVYVEGTGWKSLERMAYKLDPSKNYMVGLDITTQNFKFLDEYKNQDLTSILNLSINGTPVDLSQPGTTHIIRNRWSDTNFQILLPISCFGGIVGSPAVKSVTATPSFVSVQKGTSYTFTASVEAINGASDEVIWTFKNDCTPTDSTIDNGVLTVGETETLSEIYLTVTSVFDSTKHDEVCVFVRDVVPSFSIYTFSPSTVSASIGQTSDIIRLQISGTERDYRTVFTLEGASEPGTKISSMSDGSGGYAPYIYIQIDPNETADTLTLTAQSVAHPENTAKLTVNVNRTAVFTGTDLTLGADLSLNYSVKVNNPEAIDLSKMAVQFTMKDETTLVKDYSEDDGQYVFAFDKIAPNDIWRFIDASLVILDEDGETVKSTLVTKKNYSVADYIIDLKNKVSTDENIDENTAEKTMDLLRDLVFYCHAAEKYADGTQNVYGRLGGMFTEDTAMPAENDFSLNVLEAGSRITAAGVFFSNDNKIYVKINTEENVTLVVKKAGEIVDTVSLAAGVHTYYTDGILATEFDDVYTFELYVGDSTEAVQTLTYSVNSYAYRMQNHDKETMAALACALYRYGRSAEAFIAK